MHRAQTPCAQRGSTAPTHQSQQSPARMASQHSRRDPPRRGSAHASSRDTTSTRPLVTAQSARGGTTALYLQHQPPSAPLEHTARRVRGHPSTHPWGSTRQGGWHTRYHAHLGHSAQVGGSRSQHHAQRGTRVQRLMEHRWSAPLATCATLESQGGALRGGA